MAAETRETPSRDFGFDTSRFDALENETKREATTPSSLRRPRLCG
jgi:hypothetical protein